MEVTDVEDFFGSGREAGCALALLVPPGRRGDDDMSFRRLKEKVVARIFHCSRSKARERIDCAISAGR